MPKTNFHKWVILFTLCRRFKWILWWEGCQSRQCSCFWLSNTYWKTGKWVRWVASKVLKCIFHFKLYCSFSVYLCTECRYNDDGKVNWERNLNQRLKIKLSQSFFMHKIVLPFIDYNDLRNSVNFLKLSQNFVTCLALLVL